MQPVVAQKVGRSLFLSGLTGISLVQLREFTIIMVGLFIAIMGFIRLFWKRPKRTASYIFAASVLGVCLLGAYPVLFWSPARVNLNGWQGIICPFLVFVAVVYGLLWLILLLISVLRCIVRPELNKHMSFRIGSMFEVSHDLNPEKVHENIDKVDIIGGKVGLLEKMSMDLVATGMTTYTVKDDNKADAIREATRLLLRRVYFKHYGEGLNSLVKVFVIPLTKEGRGTLSEEVNAMLDEVLRTHGSSGFFNGVFRNIGISVNRPGGDLDTAILIQGAPNHEVDDGQVYLAAAAFLMFLRCTV